MSEASGPSHRELDELLPFYVNGTLYGEELRRVEALLERSPEARQEVAFLSRLRDRVKSVSAGEPRSELALRRALRGLRAEKRARYATPRWLKLALAACLAVIVAQGIAIFELAPGPPAEYTVLGAGAGAALLEITFAPDSSEAQIRAALDEVGAEIVGGPGALGVYRLTLSTATGDEAAIAGAVEMLRARAGVVTHVRRVVP